MSVVFPAARWWTVRGNQPYIFEWFKRRQIVDAIFEAYLEKWGDEGHMGEEKDIWT